MRISLWKRLPAILNNRCPHCLRGPVFKNLFQMHPTCSVCGIRFEREQGFFSMSIFVGYCIGFVLAALLALLLFLFNAPTTWYYYLPAGAILVTSPWIFYYSRLIWLHLDEWMDPRER